MIWRVGVGVLFSRVTPKPGQASGPPQIGAAAATQPTRSFAATGQLVSVPEAPDRRQPYDCCSPAPELDQDNT